MIKRSSVIEQSHDEILWKKNVLGSDNPKKVVHTLVYLFGKIFALRGREEHRSLLLDMVTKHYDDLEERCYLLYMYMYVGNMSKTAKEVCIM